jgi:hypothetical protein
LRDRGYVALTQVTTNAYILVETQKLFHAGDMGNDGSKVRRRISPCARHVDIEKEQSCSSSYSQLSELDEKPIIKIASHPYYTTKTATSAHGIRDCVGEDILTGHCNCPLGYDIKFVTSFSAH